MYIPHHSIQTCRALFFIVLAFFRDLSYPHWTRLTFGSSWHEHSMRNAQGPDMFIHIVSTPSRTKLGEYRHAPPPAPNMSTIYHASKLSSGVCHLTFKRIDQHSARFGTSPGTPGVVVLF
ncbi:hypothetical protein C8Q70DRAFT_989602 [Cubamyces menziesii]|nr:hypothetical protein C8Q70DRAFT_989602 [Cubamyces menziesii]